MKLIKSIIISLSLLICLNLVNCSYPIFPSQPLKKGDLFAGFSYGFGTTKPLNFKSQGNVNLGLWFGIGISNNVEIYCTPEIISYLYYGIYGHFRDTTPNKWREYISSLPALSVRYNILNNSNIYSLYMYSGNKLNADDFITSNYGIAFDYSLLAKKTSIVFGTMLEYQRNIFKENRDSLDRIFPSGWLLRFKTGVSQQFPLRDSANLYIRLLTINDIWLKLPQKAKSRYAYNNLFMEFY